MLHRPGFDDYFVVLGRLVRDFLIGSLVVPSPVRPRPLHRSITFWSGILVMAFMGGAWVRSLRHLDGVFWQTAQSSISIGQVAGILEIAVDRSHRAAPHVLIQSDPTDASLEPLFPRPLVLEIYEGQYQFTISHWLLLLAVMFPWSGLLVWRARRHRRLSEMN